TGVQNCNKKASAWEASYKKFGSSIWPSHCISCRIHPPLPCRPWHYKYLPISHTLFSKCSCLYLLTKFPFLQAMKLPFQCRESPIHISQRRLHSGLFSFLRLQALYLLHGSPGPQSCTLHCNTVEPGSG